MEMTGAHRFIEQVMVGEVGQPRIPWTGRKSKKRSCCALGNMVDNILESKIKDWVAFRGEQGENNVDESGPRKRGRCMQLIGNDIAEAIRFKLIEEHDVVATSSQCSIPCEHAGVRPITDLMGYRGNQPTRVVLVEVKTGSTSWSDAPSKKPVFFSYPFHNILDTQRNRSFAQLALQLWCIQASEHLANVTPKDALLVVAKSERQIKITPLSETFYTEFSKAMGIYVNSRLN